MEAPPASAQPPLLFQPPDAYSYSSSMCDVLEERDERQEKHPQYFTDLRKSMEANMREDAMVEEFVQHVWGLSADAMQTILSEDWSVDAKLLSRYKETFDVQPRVFRARPHTSFRMICTGLLASVCEYFGMDPRDVEDEFWDGKGRNYMDNFFARCDPDFLRVWKSKATAEEDAPPEWEMVKAFMEFSTFRTVDGYRRQAPHPALHKNQEAVNGGASNMPLNPSTAPHKPIQLKRQRSDDLLDNGIDLRVSKRARRSTTLTDDQLRFCSYAVECLSLVADRRYVTGIFIDVCQVSLYYFDRNVVLRTVTFDFSTRKGLRYLALTLFALSQCDMQHAGFDPFVLSLKRDHRDGLYFDYLERPNIKIEDYCLVFPKLDSETFPGVRYFVIEDWIDSFCGLIGHGTTNFSVREGFTAGGLSDEGLTLKMTWRFATEPHEAEIVASLRKCLYKWEDHLPQFPYAAMYSAKVLGLPWTKMTVAKPPTAPALEPMFHVSVTQAYKPLWEAGNIEEFKKAFLDCLECHYHAYSKGGVLHGAISEKSLAVWHPNEDGISNQATYKEESTSAAPRAIGVLTHWDAGTQPHRREDGIPNPREVGSGAGPFCFMASELASDVAHPGRRRRMQHYYRHDLESFFYILIWASVHYDLEEKHRDWVHPHKGLRGWLYKDSSSVEKSSIINNWDSFIVIKDYVKSGFQDLFQDWIIRLRMMFHQALRSIPEDPEVEGYDVATCNGQLTFETFMNVIGEVPRGVVPHSLEKLLNP